MRNTLNGLRPGRMIHVKGKGRFAKGTFLRELPEKPGWCEYISQGQYRLAKLSDIRIELKEEKQHAKRHADE
jgi:hypothetical protein